MGNYKFGDPVTVEQEAERYRELLNWFKDHDPDTLLFMVTTDLDVMNFNLDLSIARKKGYDFYTGGPIVKKTFKRVDDEPTDN